MSDTAMSVLGLYNSDNTLFDNLYVPEQIDRETLIMNVLAETAELEVLYTNADFMKAAIGFWSNSRAKTWDQVARVLYENYDPFINIKRDEVRTITEVRDLKGTADNTLKTNAYDSGTGTERETNNANSTDTGTITTTENFHVEGDSAITDAQDVARKEINLRTEYDLYRYIIDDFKSRFCLLIY